MNTGSLDWDYSVGSTYMCIMGVTFSSNSNYIAAIEEFGNIFVFDNSGASPVILDTINTGTSYGFATAISPANDKVAVGCSNGKMKIYNIPSGTLSNDISAHASWVTTVAYSPDGNFIITGGSDNKIKIWSAAGTLLHTCISHTEYVSGVKVTPNNQYVISASRDNKIKVWDINTGALVRTIIGHTADVNAIDISPDGSKIVSASSDSTCKIWELNTGTLMSTFGVQDSGEVRAVAWSPNGNKIVTGNILSDVTLWDVSTILGVDNDISSNVELVTIFPNPTANSVYIKLPNNEIPEYTIVFNSDGKAAYSQKSNGTSLPVESFVPGEYFIRVKTNKNNIKSFKFIKQ
jgi:WD40 repeat protein